VSGTASTVELMTALSKPIWNPVEMKPQTRITDHMAQFEKVGKETNNCICVFISREVLDLINKTYLSTFCSVMPRINYPRHMENYN
jgi:hypothetical protein